MALRPGRTSRTLKRPYTRVSKKKPRKGYVAGVPFPHIHVFEMGRKDAAYDATLNLVSEQAVQIRDNALEAARIVAANFLEKKLGIGGYFLKVLVYPHQVIREHSIATGAGADRYSQGMAHAFGHPVGIAVRTKVGQNLFTIETNKSSLNVCKEALKRAGSKLPTQTRIVVEE